MISVNSFEPEDPLHSRVLRDGWAFDLEYESEEDAAPVAITVRAPDGEYVDPAKWREVKISRVIADARVSRKVPYVGMVLQHLGEPPLRPHRDAEGFADRMAVFVERVRFVYAYSLNQGAPPIQMVAAHFDVHEATVKKWVAEIRKMRDESGAPMLGSPSEEKERFAELDRQADESAIARLRHEIEAGTLPPAGWLPKPGAVKRQWKAKS